MKEGIKHLMLKMNKYECQLVNNKQLENPKTKQKTQTKSYSHITSSNWKEISTNTAFLLHYTV